MTAQPVRPPGGNAARPVDEAAVSGAISAAGELDAPGALDPFAPDAALGTLHRFRPDSSAVRYLASLAGRPGTLARHTGALAAELARIAAGRSAVAPARRDRRFADPAWMQNPMLRRTVQAYLALSQTAGELLAGAGLDWRDNERLNFVLTNLIAASAPSNYLLLSPAAWKAFIDTGGLSLVRGARALIRDMASAPHIPTMVEPDAFTIGQDLAVTPGAVVARTDVCELIQYQPATATVHQFPLLMVPPMINKYYITDLAPGRSMLEFFVSQGYQVFVVSWRNPGRGARHWDLNAYGGAVADAAQRDTQHHRRRQGQHLRPVRRRHPVLDGRCAPERHRADGSGRQPLPGRNRPRPVTSRHDSRTDEPGHRRGVYPRLPRPRLHGRAHARRGVRLAPAR